MGQAVSQPDFGSRTTKKENKKAELAKIE